MLRTEAGRHRAASCVLFTCAKKQTTRVEKQYCPPEAQTVVSPADMKGIWYNRHSVAAPHLPILPSWMLYVKPGGFAVMCAASFAARHHHLMNHDWHRNQHVTAGIQGFGGNCKTKWATKYKSYEVQSDFFHLKTPQKPDNLGGAGLVNLFKCWILYSRKLG